MLVHGETERENDRQEITFLKNGGTVHLTGFFNQSKPLRNVYMCSEQISHHNYFKAVSWQLFPS